MDYVFTLIGLGLLGLMIGSFGGATVWRLRARQLGEEKAAGEQIDAAEYSRLKPLMRRSVRTDRSLCLHCHHQLMWYDLLPLFSWLFLRGKCRYCHVSIGWLEPVIEIGMAAFFIISFLVWQPPLESPVELVAFGLWLVVGAGLIVLCVYDAKWFLLPDRIVFPLVGLAAISAFLKVAQTDDTVLTVSGILLSGVILSGLYTVLYVLSRGKWIGLGDIKLGLVLALMLAEWPLAFLTLFLANLIGCIIVLPGLATRKLKRTSHIPFGPMLIVAYFIAGLFGQAIIEWYFRLLIGI